MTEEARLTFRQELEALRVDLVRLAAMVREAIVRGTDALLEGDMNAAQQLIDDDDYVDALSMDIEETCTRLLALQQPMAGDLRQIVAALKINSDVERSGDLMVNVAKGVRRIDGTDLPPPLRGLLGDMCAEATRLFKMAVDAYVEEDGALGAAIDDVDDRLDEIHADYVQAIFEQDRAAPLDLQVAVQLALIGRYYERIGDHAVNIGELVRYLADGQLPEHKGAERVRAEWMEMEAAGENGAGDGGG